MEELAQLQKKLALLRKEKTAADEAVAALVEQEVDEEDEQLRIAQATVESLQDEQNRIQAEIRKLEAIGK